MDSTTHHCCVYVGLFLIFPKMLAAKLNNFFITYS